MIHLPIVKYERPLTPEEQEEARLWALWLMYGRAPATPTAPGQKVDLGEIGETKSDRGVERWCPYSTATGLRHPDESTGLSESYSLVKTED